VLSLNPPHPDRAPEPPSMTKGDARWRIRLARTIHLIEDYLVLRLRFPAFEDSAPRLELAYAWVDDAGGGGIGVARD
jgi:hypothetical protein